MINEPNTEKEASKFLKFIKHSEYSVVEQLNKLTACISLLILLINFEPYHKALMKVLSEAYVAHKISIEKVDQLVGNITTNNMIAFFDDEILFGGHGNTKALYITISCKGYTFLRALLDNGSSINVILMATLSRLPVDPSHIKNTYLMIHTFDGTRKEVVPSTLHQMVKFVVEEQLINVVAEEDIVATLTTANSYIDVNENAMECSL
ncbi:hypothetical protein CRYUN_Cryun21dG0069400 [Craigia yunnanensis]